MPMKGGDAEMRVIDEWDGGAGWIAHPDEAMERASHALVSDGDVWVVDPVDADGVDDLLSGLGDVVGVVVALDRHERDCDAVAKRHDVPVYVPDWMSGVADDFEASVERFGRSLGDSGYRAITVRDTGLPRWQELGLYNEDEGTLLVSESVGTADFFRAAGERLGVHPALRLFPPRRTLGGLSPERILVGHGEGVFEDAPEALRDALAGSRRNAAGLYGKQLKTLVSG
ncbi:hypothetical protein ACFO0N_18450 [Halobium salinum]|uniref:Uncharacterized protein n=1 Tax=Halobium salinum TaxID=1364940 RepID=A0ABD5PGG6_9EURY|nr:hypothetical protein [Halobium salinum]